MDTVACLLMGGPDYEIEVGGARYRFEMHPNCGPIPVKENGRELELGPRHKFWVAVGHWVEQGRRVENGICVWATPDPLENMVHLFGSNYMYVSPGTSPEDAIAKLPEKLRAIIQAGRDQKPKPEEPK